MIERLNMPEPLELSLDPKDLLEDKTSEPLFAKLVYKRDPIKVVNIKWTIEF